MNRSRCQRHRSGSCVVSTRRTGESENHHSKTLEKAVKKWTAMEKEMYGIISASRRWYPYCANKVIFHTDHQPLRFIRNQKDPRGKIVRWITELENLDYSIE